MIRSPSSGDTLRSGRRLLLIGPVLDGYTNTQLPFGLNSGGLWAGRGISARLSGGFQFDFSRFHALVIPEITRSANLGFPLIGDTTGVRSAYALPFYAGPRSIDLPERFGDRPLTRIAPGQSAAWMTAGAVDVGASTENQWWGPAVQNALVMSNNAEGIPSVFVRAHEPVTTRIGAFDAKAIFGELTESLYFDDNASNDRRSISGMVATYSPSAAPNLTVGLTRVVYAAHPPGSSLTSHALDALTRWSTVRGDSTSNRGVDQLYSMFGRWVFPASGVEIYGEWARILPPVSLRDWLVAPQYTLGYTVGMQLARPLTHGTTVRFQTEVTNLEQTSPTLAGDTLTVYTSRAVAQGYTQRGKTIGAAIGPGGSSQMAGLDFMRSRWDAGLFAERIRSNDDVYYLQPTGFSFFSQDVTVLGGLRGTFRHGRSELHAEFSWQQRLNFLFQNLRGGFGKERTNDFQNHSVRFWFAP